jgi:glycosyltransferase involved in cell wall biosynthesis
MKVLMRCERILYLSYYYPLDVVKSRGLPGNIASTNRVKRIAGALVSAQHIVQVATPGICARCGFTSKLFHGTYSTLDNGIGVTVAPAVVIPFVGALLEPLLFPIWMLLFLRRSRFDGAIIYNYSPSFALISILLRCLGIPFVAQVEDITQPKFSDWRIGNESRPVQQLVLWFCMKTVAGLSSGLIVPSKRFQFFLPEKKPCLVLGGCVTDSEWGEDRPIRLQIPIRVLFAGRYLTDDGLDLLIAAIKLLRSEKQYAEHFVFDCCGTKDYPNELRLLSTAKEDPVIRLHGLLSDDEYRSLLAETDVALVLQKVQGRHANLRSPSKAYEFLAGGKLVITTDVGDFALLSGECLIMLQHESAEELVRILVDITENPKKYEKIAIAARTFSRRESSSRAVGKKLIAFLTQVFSKSQSSSHG